MHDERVGRKSHTPLCFVCISILNRKPSVDFFSYFMAVDLVKPIPARVSSYSLTRNYDGTAWSASALFRIWLKQPRIHSAMVPLAVAATIQELHYMRGFVVQCAPLQFMHTLFAAADIHFTATLLCSWKHILEIYSDFAAENTHLNFTATLRLQLQTYTLQRLYFCIWILFLMEALLQQHINFEVTGKIASDFFQL